MKRIFTLRPFNHPLYPVEANCRSLLYHNVYPSIEIAKNALQSRFGDVIIRVSPKLKK